MNAHLLFPRIGQHKNREEQHCRDELHVLRVKTERNRNRHARLVENRTNQHHGGGAEEGGVAEEVCADDDGRKPGDHRACAHRNVEETLLLTHDRARERNQRIRNNQTKDFDRALVAA